MKVGYLDYIDDQMIRGWAQEGSEPAEVKLIINTVECSFEHVTWFRHDLVNSGYNGASGFALRLPEKISSNAVVDVTFCDGTSLNESPREFVHLNDQAPFEVASIACPIFLHIPKTAGSAVMQAVVQCTPHRLHVNPANLPEEVFKFKLSSPLPKLVFGHLSYGVHKDFAIQPDYITLLRDPVERVVSCYRYNKSIPQSPYADTRAFAKSCEAFVKSCMTEETNNHMCRIIAGTSNREGMFIDDQWLLDKAIDNIETHFSLVGTTCNIEDFIKRLGNKLSWNERPTLNQVNVTGGAPLLLDDATLSTIKVHNRLDIELYKHVKERRY